MIYGSKKATMTALGGGLSAMVAILIPLLFSLLDAGQYFSPEDVKNLTAVAVIAIGLATGTYNVGQGLADFKKEAATTQAKADLFLSKQEVSNGSVK